jgi:translation initiation factor IF-2
MSKVRVYEIAKQLNMDPKSAVALFQSMGVGDVRNHMSAVDTDLVDRLKRHLERQKTPEVVEEKIKPGVVKRRARPGEVVVPSARPSASAAVPAPAAPAVEHERVTPPAPSGRGAPPETEAETVPRAAPSARGKVSPPPASSAVATRVAPMGIEPPKDVTIEAPPVLAKAPASSRSAPATAAGASGEAPAKEETPASRKSSARSKRGAESKTSIENVDFDAEQARPAAVELVPPPQAQAAPPPPVAAEAGRSNGAEAAAPFEPPAAQEAPVASTPRPSARGAAKPREAEGETPPPTQVSPRNAEQPKPPSDLPKPGPAVSEPPRRPSSPPRTGIDVWQGRPGVPMPQVARSTAAPGPRRTTYDPRAQVGTPQRPGMPTGPFMGNRPGGRPGQRPGFRPMGRPGQSAANRKPPTMMEMAAHKKVIKIEESVSLQKLAGMMSLKVTDVLLKLLGMGMTGVNINSTIDADTAKILASEFGWTVEDVAVSEEQSIQAATGVADKDKTDHELLTRPPIVTVMGHVDHGKTSLLDRIRKATVAAGEAGGITQHIGAYRVETPKGTIAFLDTPGHEAFTSMRARGAQVTDIVVLVVAADDGVMPQTREAINHAQSAKVPIIVAVNKIDKPSADPDRVKRDLSNFGLNPEEWGGETLFCHVSALTGQGIEQLLEAIALQAEVLELSAAPKRRAQGVVIEALLDRGRGPVARVMVQDGTLRQGDILLAGPAWGKVRAMTDEFGRTLAAAGPSTPVEVLGLNDVPSAGDPVHAVRDAKQAEEIAESRRKKANKSLIPQDSRVSLEALKERLAEGEQLDLKLIIKGDVQGSVEAVAAALIKLTTPKVKVTIVHAAVGAITEGDVNLAIASKAIIVGFNVRPAGKASQSSEAGGVEIRLYNIIYNAVDDIRSAMEGLLPTTKLEKALGTAEVRQVFKITKVGTIAGCYVTSGLVRRGAEARLVRDSIVVYTGKLSSLRRVKDDVKEVAEGTECGISLENYQDIKEGDIIEAYEIEEVKQKLN